jgi:hypothetical protein
LIFGRLPLGTDPRKTIVVTGVVEQDDASERRLAMEPLLSASSRLVSDVDSHVQQATMVNSLENLK